MYREKGWKYLPLSVKIIFVVLILGVISSLWFIPSVSLAGYPLFALALSGTYAFITFFILDIIWNVILIIGIWNRSEWTWEIGIMYFGFFVLTNSWSLFEILRSSLPLSGIYLSSTVINGISIVVNLIFLVVMYRQRFYFEPSLGRSLF